MKPNDIYGLQILKLLCALLVVNIHFGGNIWAFLSPLSRTAVPIFFIITGYFLGSEITPILKDKIKRRIKKIVKISTFAFSIYIIFHYIHSDGMLIINNLTNIGYWVEMITIGDVPEIHLWYLVALLQSLGFLYICCQLQKTNWMKLLIPLGLILNLLFGSYNFLLPENTVPNHLVFSRNSLTIGLPCILIGMWIRRIQPKLPSQRNIAAIALLGLLGLYFEAIILKKLLPKQFGDIIILTIPVATTIFIYFLRFNIKTSFGFKLASWGKEYSLDIYIWHFLIATLIINFLHKLQIYDYRSLLLPLTVIFTLILCYVISKYRLNRFYSI